MLFSGIAANALAAVASAAGALVAVVGARLKKIKELITRATVDTRMAINSTDGGQRGAPIGRTGAAACFHLFPRLSFSGRCGFPRSSLYRLTRCSLSPYFT